jgi:hypothetical protein
MSRDIFKCFELNKNEKVTYQILRDTLKAECRGSFIALNGYIRKEESSSSNNLSFNLRKLERKKKKNPQT